MAAEGGRSTAGRRRSQRSRLDPETRRAQLIDAAVDLIAERGPAAFAIDDVADAAGVSRSLVYAYFGDRDGLAAEVYLRTLEQLDREVGLRLTPDELALRRIVEGCMEFAERNPEAWRLLVGDPARQHPVVRAARADRAARLSADWEGVAVAPEGDGARPAGLAGAQLAAEAALGMLESGVLHWLDETDMPAGEAAALLAAVLGSGITSRRLARPATGPGRAVGRWLTRRAERSPRS